MNIINVDNLSKDFRTLKKAPGFRGSLAMVFRPEYQTVRAVNEITFSVAEGERLAFIGPNGAGKSTTIKMLTGILHPTRGSATVLDKVPWQARQDLAYEIGTVFGQKSQLWYHLPASDSFDLLAHIYGIDEKLYAERRAYLVELFDLGPYVHTPVRKLSLGERMRCEIAASLLHRPRVIFLDEPTIGLDVVVRQRIRDLILELNRVEGVTIFLTSHDAGDIEVLCRRVIVINHGELIYDGRVSDLKHNYLRTRTVSLKLASAWQGFNAPGVELLKHKDYGVKLQVDVSTTSIEAVIAQLLARYSIADITIDNPPMEEIIGKIYADG